MVEGYRKTYEAVKTYPFIHTLALLLLSPFAAWLPVHWAVILGLLAFTSVPTAILCWRLSYAVSLCPWHRAQCAVMLLPAAIPACRISMTGLNVAWVWGGVSALLLASLVNAYMVFVKPAVRKGRAR